MIGQAPLSPDDPIDLLDLRTRTYASLRRQRKPVETVGELAAMTPGDLLDLRGIGITALADVECALGAHGLELAAEQHFSEPSGCCGNMHSVRCGDCPQGP